jgi:hypothetical protein
MKPSMNVALVFVLCLASFGVGLFAQRNTNDSNPLAAMDAVKAAPKNHKVLYEDDEVRILKVTVLPGETEAYHTHQWNSILTVYQGGKAIEHIKDGPSIPIPEAAPNDPFPTVMMRRPEQIHAIENTGTTVQKLIRVEFKKPFRNAPQLPGFLIPAPAR